MEPDVSCACRSGGRVALMYTLGEGLRFRGRGRTQYSPPSSVTTKAASPGRNACPSASNSRSRRSRPARAAADAAAAGRAFPAPSNDAGPAAAPADARAPSLGSPAKGLFVVGGGGAAAAGGGTVMPCTESAVAAAAAAAAARTGRLVAPDMAAPTTALGTGDGPVVAAPDLAAPFPVRPGRRG